MRPGSGMNPGVVHLTDMPDKRLRGLTLVFPFLGIAKVDKSIAEECPDTSLIHCTSGIFHEEIHVIESGRTGADHFKAGKSCSPVYILTGQVSFKRPDFLGEPILQDHIISITA